MLLVDDLAAGGTKNLRHTPRGLVTLYLVVLVAFFSLTFPLISFYVFRLNRFRY